MGKQLDKVKQLTKSTPVNFHGNMLSVKDNAMLIVVNIRGILKPPSVPLNGDGNDSVVIPGRMVYPAGIPFVFFAQQTSNRLKIVTFM